MEAVRAFEKSGRMKTRGRNDAKKNVTSDDDYDVVDERQLSRVPKTGAKFGVYDTVLYDFVSRLMV